MTSYTVDRTVEEIQERIENRNQYIVFCHNQLKHYKKPSEASDKYESAGFGSWMAEIKFLERLLDITREKAPSWS